MAPLDPFHEPDTTTSGRRQWRAFLERIVRPMYRAGAAWAAVFATCEGRFTRWMILPHPDCPHLRP